MGRLSVSVLFACAMTVMTACNSQTANQVKSTGEEQKESANGAGSAYIVWPAHCHDGGICLVYTGSVKDRDADGVSDDDEKALRTDPSNSVSMPIIGEIAGAIGRQRLPSFERGFSQIIVLPKFAPDGSEISGLESNNFRKPIIQQLGIQPSTLKAYGLSIENGFAFQKFPGIKGDQNKMPVRRVGGFNWGLISQEKTGDGSANSNHDLMRNPGESKTQPAFGVPPKNDSPTGENKPKPDSPDGGTNKPDGGTNKRTTGDDFGGSALPLTEEDYKRVVAKLNGSRTPLTSEPIITSDGSGIDFNPHRTIALVVESEGKPERFNKALKFFLTVPAFNNPAATNTDFGPNGGIVPTVIDGSGWPKH